MNHVQTAYAKNGWSEKETALLFETARKAAEEGRPMKGVFDQIAQITGRKPNSIRNYYYMKAKEDASLARAIFIPFQQEEVRDLVRTMLQEQARGRSVRSIAMELSHGDKKAMLRYQNKFRSTLRTRPELVRQIMQELQAQGLPAYDPFAYQERRAHGKKQDLADVIAELAGNLSKAGQEGVQVICCLNQMLRRAAQPSVAFPQWEEMRRQYEEKNALLRRQADQYKKELARQTARNAELERRIQILEDLNRSFSNLSGMERISGLSEYVAALSKCLE